MGRTRIVIALLMALTLVASACGDDDGAASTEATAAPTTTTTAAPTTTTAAPTTTTTAAPTTTTTTTEPAGPELPPTGVTAVIDMPYKWGDDAGVATQDELPFPIGGVEAHWYQAGDVYAVVYVGLDLEASGPLCPGNSIFTDNGYEFTSNSPTPGASCEGSAPVPDPPSGVQICNGVVSYLTMIPNGTMGTLYASIELYPGGGTNYGASGAVEADLDYMAEIDPAILGC